MLLSARGRHISEENGLEEELVGGAMQTVRCIAIE
jgi:hypothetical protein